MNRSYLWIFAVAAALVIGFYAGGHWRPNTTPGTSAATIDLSCGDKTYTVSTGTNGGECQSSGQNAVCGDGSTNKTEVSCASGCINAHGSASCQVKSK